MPADIAAAVPATSTASVGDSLTLDSPRASPTPVRQTHQSSRAFELSIATTGSVGRLLDMLGTSADATIALAAIGASPTAIATAVLSRGRNGGSAIDSHTSSLAPAPGPGPAPGGAGGGAAAGGCSSAASSASFVLVSALFQAAPNVMLPLHISQPSWYTSFCALILERPD